MRILGTRVLSISWIFCLYREKKDDISIILWQKPPTTENSKKQSENEKR